MFVVRVYCAHDRQPDDPLAPLLFDVAAGTLFLSLVSRLLGIIFNTAVPGRAVGAMIALLFYGSTAVFVSVYRGDRGERSQSLSDVKYVPR